MSVTIDGSAFREALANLGKEFRVAVADSLTNAVDAAAKDAFSTNLYRNHTWKLRSSTKATVDPFNAKGRLTNSVKYAPFIEYGTKAHRIVPNKAKRLRFYWHRVGAWISSKGVNHPGTAPRPFFKHAGDVGKSVLEAELSRRVEMYTTRFNQAA